MLLRELRDRPLENLCGGWWGGGVGGGEVQKKYSRKGKLNEKNSCTPINPKNIHAMVSARGSVMILRRAPIDSIET